MANGDLVTVQKFGTPQEAHLARSILDAAGIEACVTDESAATWLWHVGTALGGARVQVAAHDAAAARAVLEQIDTPSTGSAQDAWRCLLCGAEVDANFDVCWSCETPRGENPQDVGHASRTRSTASSPPTPSDDTANSPAEQPGDADATRAWRAALFGIFFPPLFVYSLYLVLKTMNQDVSPRGMRYFCGALGISLLAISLFAAAFIAW